MLINFEEDVEQLTKDELGAELNLERKDIRKNKKAELVKMFLGKFSDEFSKRKIYKKYSRHFALHPVKVQELLSITSTERKRWTKQGKLVVCYYEPFYKWGKNLKYPMYDAFELSKITSEMIESWREEHQEKTNQNRRKAH